MGLKDEFDFEFLVNEAERIVLEELEAFIDEGKWDDAGLDYNEETVLDVVALALNQVKPFYRVNLIGNLYAHAIDQSDYADEVKTAVKKAIAKVSKNPLHE